MNRVLKNLWLIALSIWGLQPVLVSAAMIDSQLASLFTLALNNNPELGAAKAVVETDEYDLILSEAQTGPRVDFISEQSLAWMKRDFARTANQLRASYPLYQPDLHAKTELSQVAIQVSYQNLLSVQQDLLLEIAMQYHRYWQQQAESLFLEKEIATYQSLLKQSKQQLQVGFKGLNDLVQIQAKIESVRANSVAAKQRLQRIYYELVALVNSDFDITSFIRPAILSKRVVDFPLKTINLNNQAWLNQLQNNPEIKRVKLKQQKIAKQVLLDRLADGPKVEVFTSYIYNNSRQNFYDDMQGIKGGLQINVPIYLSGRTDAKIAKTRSQGKQLKALEAIQLNKLTRIAQQAQSDYELGVQQWIHLQKAVESNQLAIKAVEQGLVTGDSNITDLLNAYSALHQSQKKLPMLQADLSKSWWTMQWVTGDINHFSTKKQ